MARPFIAAIEDFVISEDVTFHDESGHWGLLALQGPRAAALLALALGQEVPALPMYASTTLPAALAIRCAVCGAVIPVSWAISCLHRLPALPDVWNALWDTGEACEARAVGLEMLDTVRIEAGIPVYGRDMTEETIPCRSQSRGRSQLYQRLLYWAGSHRPDRGTRPRQSQTGGAAPERRETPRTWCENRLAAA